MIFNSLEFIFIFLPVVYLGFCLAARLGNFVSVVWLSAASFVFYGIWNWHFLPLLVASTLLNFAVGFLILRGGRFSGFWCALGVMLNIGGLGVFKYADFIIQNVNALAGLQIPPLHLTLPTGISFFTFTQIAFLIDARRGAVSGRYELAGYSLFVSYFPHLIAGPILHHAKMIPQFQKLAGRVVNWDNLASGLTLFAIGMGKKLLLADPLSLLASPVFDSAAKGMEPSFLVAWSGAIAYSFQIYFDFSGYSDMAVGLSRMFNVELPINFASPYKSTSIIDFWRRWHISLSSFLRDYLYIPLGGNRKGPLRRYGNLMVTMLLGGLWHGASWGFVLWGGLHGLYLIVNHLWQRHAIFTGKLSVHRRRIWIEAMLILVLCTIAWSLCPKRTWIIGVILLGGFLWRNFLVAADDSSSGWSGRILRTGFTFSVVTISWVFFRSTTIEGAHEMLQGMFFANGLAHHDLADFSVLGVTDIRAAQKILFISAILVWLAPDSNQITVRLRAAGSLGAIFSGILLLVCLTRIGKPSEFLYFQF
jgi:alginate O-acetyltransferase complex protein AlgI